MALQFVIAPDLFLREQRLLANAGHQVRQPELCLQCPDIEHCFFDIVRGGLVPDEDPVESLFQRHQSPTKPNRFLTCFLVQFGGGPPLSFRKLKRFGKFQDPARARIVVQFVQWRKLGRSRAPPAPRNQRNSATP